MVSGGPSLQFHAFTAITSLLLPIRGTGGYCFFRLTHRSLFSVHCNQLVVLSCAIVTIRGFDFNSIFLTVCHSLFQLLFCCLSLFSQKWPTPVFLRNRMSAIEFSKIKNSRNFLPPFQQYMITKASNVFFLLRRKDPLCQFGGMARISLQLKSIRVTFLQ